MKQLNIGYGTLDLRTKQGLDIAELQIKHLSEKKPREWFFDIIHTPNQTPRALMMKPEVESILKRYNKLAKWKFTVRLNVNDKKLRARNEMYKKIYEKNITDVNLKKPNE